MAIDLRSRRDSEAVLVSVEDFFRFQLPELTVNSQQLVGPWLALNAVSPISIDCDGRQWQLHCDSAGFRADTGIAEQGLHLGLTAEDFSGLINDQFTPMTFFVAGRLDIRRGELSMFLDWWLLLRALLDRRPIHVPGALRFDALDGSALDLQRSFSLDDPIDEMREFLEVAGFLHLRGVFSEQEMAAVSDDMDASVSSYHEGDDRSWWASTKDGERRLVRMQGFEQRSKAAAALLDDPRFQKLGQLGGCDHRHRGLENNKIEALIKPLQVVAGISDLPWHKDCSLGRHSYECCSLTVGVSVTGAGPDSGQLRVIAGSHRVLMWPALIADAESCGLPVLDLATQTGDVTVHLSCTHHMAQAPTARERRVMYTSFGLPDVEIDSSEASRARINEAREQAYKTVSQ